MPKVRVKPGKRLQLTPKVDGKRGVRKVYESGAVLEVAEPVLKNYADLIEELPVEEPKVEEKSAPTPAPKAPPPATTTPAPNMPNPPAATGGAQTPPAGGEKK